MNKQTDGKADFYAFISHKSADTKFALKLQKFIESYNLPTNIRKMKNMQQKRLTPICSYEVDFSSNPLLHEMEDKLRRSKYLILICSEELIKSGPEYIDFEIRSFIESKQAEGIDPLTRIIPIITTGEFGSAEHECCPDALKELGDRCPIALDRKKYRNDRTLFLHIISALLDIDYVVIENRDKKRQRNRAMVAGLGLFLLLAAGIGLGEYYIPRQSYYVDFVMKDGLPQGIGQLSEAETQRMGSHYVITTRKHKIESLEYVNAYGNLIDHGADARRGDRPSAYIFRYTDAGLNSVTYTNKSGVPYFIMQYSADSVSAVDLRNPYDADEAFYTGSGYESNPAMLLADLNLEAHSDISRFRYERSPEGYVTGVTFCSDSTGRLAQDQSVYGFEYVLDAKGRIIETYFLDALGDRRLNSQGLYCRTFAYDDRDDLVKWANYGADGALKADSNGIVQCVFSYDDHHNMIQTAFLDERGEPMFVASYGAATQVRTVDARGNLIRIELLDTDGSFTQRGEFCVQVQTYDENGFLATRVWQDAAGNAVQVSSKNYAEIRYVNDENGNPLTITYHDKNGEPINNAWGFATEVIEYDDLGRALKNAYFDADGNPADYRGYGYCSMETVYDHRGRELSISYYGPSGEPVNTVGPTFGFGYHKLETVYEYGAHTKQVLTYYDASGVPVNLRSSLGEEYAQAVVYVQNGEITYMAEYRADGSVYGEILESETNRSSQAEPITTRRHISSDGNVRLEVVTRYSISGVTKQMTYTEFDKHGKVTSELEILYHDNGEQKSACSLNYDENGIVTEKFVTEYNERGQEIKAIVTEPSKPGDQPYIVESFYDASGNLAQEVHTQILRDDIPDFVIKNHYLPDGSKSLVERISYDDHGKVIQKSDTVYENGKTAAKTEYDYDENGVLYFVTAINYNADGSTAKMTFLDYGPGWLYAATEFLYHTDGTKEQITTFYDENQNMIDVSRRILDKNGNVTG